MWRNYLKQRQAQVEAAMETLVPACTGEPLAEMMKAMRYSLFAGGKRLRPILLMAAADAVGRDGRSFLHAACALEMIHTYSLIHDDLPAMDDDDYRRGMLTNHKVFGDGMAILAGDGLLTLAFEVLLSQPDSPPATLNRVAREVAAAAGSAPDDVLAAVDSVNTKYEQHCRAARDLVREHFSASSVLTRLIDDATSAAARRLATPGVTRRP